MDYQLYQILCGSDAWSCLATWPGPTSLKIIPVLYKPAYRLPQGTGGGVQVVQRSKTYLAKNGGGRILASRQGFGELKTEQLGGHSQEQQRHRQAPIDDDDDEGKDGVTPWAGFELGVVFFPHFWNY